MAQNREGPRPHIEDGWMRWSDLAVVFWAREQLQYTPFSFALYLSLPLSISLSPTLSLPVTATLPQIISKEQFLGYRADVQT